MKKGIHVFLIALLGGTVALGINELIQDKKEIKIKEKEITHPVKLVSSAKLAVENTVDFTTAAEMTVHAVVHVNTEYMERYNNAYNNPFRYFFWGEPFPQQESKPVKASGSGVIISKDGYIVTNNHVIQKADKVMVTLNNKKAYSAEIVGADKASDIALLKINAENLPYIPYGNSDNLKVGEWVLAVGNPFNLTSTVTAGIVSAKGRDINILEGDPYSELPPIESFIQTDAAVNPGNSGGALVNTTGELIGINTAIASNTGSYAGYSFAIPVNLVKKVIDDLLEFGIVQRAFIGVIIRNIDSDFADEKGIDEIKGVYVSELSEGGAAKEAGIKAGDIIRRIGAIEVNNVSELQEQVGRFRPGDQILVTVLRDGKEREIPIVLKNKDGDTKIIHKEDIKITSLLGAQFAPVSKEEKNKLKIENGVKITKLAPGKLMNAGIKEGFIITKIDKIPINKYDDVVAALENKKGGVLIEGTYSNGLRAYYGFGM